MCKMEQGCILKCPYLVLGKALALEDFEGLQGVRSLSVDQHSQDNQKEKGLPSKCTDSPMYFNGKTISLSPKHDTGGWCFII